MVIRLMSQFKCPLASPWHPLKKVQTFSQPQVLSSVPGRRSISPFLGVLPQEYSSEMQVCLSQDLEGSNVLFPSPPLPWSSFQHKPERERVSTRAACLRKFSNFPSPKRSVRKEGGK